MVRYNLDPRETRTFALDLQLKIFFSSRILYIDVTGLQFVANQRPMSRILRGLKFSVFSHRYVDILPQRLYANKIGLSVHKIRTMKIIESFSRGAAI